MDETLVETGGDGVAIVHMNRPQTRNALSAEMRAQLAGHFEALAVDEGVNVVVLTGGPDCFAAGADIRAMASASPTQIALRRTEKLWEPIRTFPKPLIAAVNGWALGGGCELAMHADIIVAGESARFGQPEIKVGIMPGAGGTQRLVRAVGKFKAMKMLLTGEPVSAIEAEAMGLVSEVVPDRETLERALHLARAIAKLPPLAARKIKEVVLAGADQSLDSALLTERQAFQLLFDTRDQKEGMAAFLEKRKPDFTGR
ncbi:enoyl-CoA hydratase-related protein [Aurantimonas sp. VKM B-3413]|uniref:enoyl-CoA hydratase-related protein n=1 Tax=Aurantimonas sp. VKM B-3413 TaxID=2779401 RepID=UPI001E39FB0C|nr:enoyl-CoA hydratase-related protein [Aurantimonas sp. VKM B-3413]MCB8840291.1 enoyl-CoA hydratase/isomerase family protein [Aurantimonas sp. VKM B-3413]